MKAVEVLCKLGHTLPKAPGWLLGWYYQVVTPIDSKYRNSYRKDGNLDTFFVEKPNHCTMTP